jgi:hypothetical protein
VSHTPKLVHLDRFLGRAAFAAYHTRMFRIVLTLAATCLSSAALCVEKTPSDLSRHRQILTRCGGAESELAAQPAISWNAQPNALKEHAALRSALGEPMPRAGSLIMLHAQGGHLSTIEYSIALERGPNRLWTGTAVGRSQIWVKDSPSTPLPRKQWTLSKESGQRIDHILQSSCLYAEPNQFARAKVGPPGLGAMTQRLDVLTPTRRRSAAFLGGEAKGLTAELVDLAMPAN